MHCFYTDKVVVITGGSSGIGLSTANEFAKQKAKLILIARDKVKLDAAAELLKRTNENIFVECFPADVSDKNHIGAVINAIGYKYNRIDLLINCAGIITCGRFADQSFDDLENSVQVNYLGSLYTSKEAWPWLKKTKGQLSFVSSVAGYIGLIGYSSYAPTKFALTGLAECLKMEAKADGIRISIIYPPDTDTPFLQYERAHTLPESIALSKNIKVMSPEKVAHAYINGLQKNKFEIYCDFNSKVLRSFKNNFPKVFNYFTDKVVKKALSDQQSAISNQKTNR